MKRQITPHKGGRTAQLHVLLTPDMKKKLKAICRKAGISMADWIEKQIASATPGAAEDEE